MKNLVFVALNSSWSQSNLALYYLREMIRDMDYPCKILSYTLKEPLLQVMEDIYRQRPDVIMLSAYIWNRQYLVRLQRELAKVLPEALFVIGGPEAQFFEESPQCAVFTGPGEAAFLTLAEADFCPDALKDGISPIPLTDIPFPYRPADREDLSGHLVYYECYRGCPYHCIYCLSGCDDRSEPRFDLSLPGERERLYQELRALSALEPRTLKFIDRSFNVQKDLSHAIWDWIREEEPPHDSHFEIYPDLLDGEDIRLLSQIPEGKIRFEIGIQSINGEVLRNCGRHSDWGKSRKGLLQLKDQTRVRVHADLIAGLPGENYASVIRSLDELCACEPAAVQLGMLKILPDTPMRKMARDRGYRYLDDPPYQVLASDALSFDELCELDQFAHLLSLYWNKEEYPVLWQTLLQKYTASTILKKLRDLHMERDLPFHSVSKQRRAQIMELVQNHLC